MRYWLDNVGGLVLLLMSNCPNSWITTQSRDHRSKKNKQIFIYSLNILSGVMTERFPTSRQTSVKLKKLEWCKNVSFVFVSFFFVCT